MESTIPTKRSSLGPKSHIQEGIRCTPQARPEKTPKKYFVVIKKQPTFSLFSAKQNIFCSHKMQDLPNASDCQSYLFKNQRSSTQKYVKMVKAY